MRNDSYNRSKQVSKNISVADH